MTTTSFQVRKEVSGTQGAVSGSLNVNGSLSSEGVTDLLPLYKATPVAIANNTTSVLTKLGNTGVANEVACPSGSIILCAFTGSTGPTTITLPSVESGYRITLIINGVNGSATGNLVINTATLNFYSNGSVICNGAGTDGVAGEVAAVAGTDNILTGTTNTAATDAIQLGTIIEFHGLSATHWFVKALPNGRGASSSGGLGFGT